MIKLLHCIFPTNKKIKHIYNCSQKRKRTKNIAKIKKEKLKAISKIPPYLRDNNYETELNYKLWSTKGARFNASARNHVLNKLSSKSIGYMSAYLIIIGVINLYEIKIFGQTFTNNEVGFATTAISVLILLFSQLESSEAFLLKAERYHNCSLDIAELYDKLRLLKNNSNISNKDKQLVLEDINNQYEVLLKKYDNHLPIDYKKFQITKRDYFNISRFGIVMIVFTYYFQVKLIYHILIYLPIVFLLLLKLKSYLG